MPRPISCLWVRLFWRVGGAFGLADILDSLKNGERLQWPSDGPDRMYDLSMRCWSAEPRDRPTFAQVNDELQILPAILRNVPAEESRGNRRGGGAHGGYESEASYQASAPGDGLGVNGECIREEEVGSGDVGFRLEPATAPWLSTTISTTILNAAFDDGAELHAAMPETPGRGAVGAASKEEGGYTRVSTGQIAAATATLSQGAPASVDAASPRKQALRDTGATDTSGYTRVSTDQIAAATATLSGPPGGPLADTSTVSAPPPRKVALHDTGSGDEGAADTSGYTRISTDQIAAATATLQQAASAGVDATAPRRSTLRDTGAADTSGYTRISTDQIAAATATLQQAASAGVDAAAPGRSTLRDTRAADTSGYTRICTDQIVGATATLQQAATAGVDTAAPRRSTLRDNGAADTSGYTRISTDQIAAATATLQQAASVSVDAAAPWRSTLRDTGADDTSGYTRISTDEIAAATITLREEETSQARANGAHATNDTAV